MAALELAKNLVFYKRSKHIDIKYYFMRDFWKKGLIGLIYIPRTINLADYLIKKVINSV